MCCPAFYWTEPKHTLCWCERTHFTGIWCVFGISPNTSHFVHPSYSYASCAYNKYTLIYHYYCYYISIRIVSPFGFFCVAVENEKEKTFKTSQAVCNQTFEKWNENNNNGNSTFNSFGHCHRILFRSFSTISLLPSRSIPCMRLLCKRAFTSAAKRIEHTHRHQHYRGQRTHKHTPNHSTPLINYVIYVIKYIIYNNVLIACRHFLWNFYGNSFVRHFVCPFFGLKR